MQKITILGAGLCGTMLALRLVQRGYQVDLYEKRPDLRKTELAAGRSINLALSDRGWQGLKMVGLEAQASEMVIPMYGRMIHPLGGEANLYRYSGRPDEYINSISRPGLNALLLDEADKFDALQVHFETEVKWVDLDTQTIELFDSATQSLQAIQSDVIIGTDGAGSVLRRAMQARSGQLRFDYAQKYLDTGYKELSILPGPGASYQIEQHALHIWPREGYMMIALPNLDGSFTLTLFMPYEGKFGFDNFETKGQVEDFVADQFSDVVDQLGHVGAEYFENPTSSLGTIKCYPWVGGKRTLLMGDAAHAIVPFYGQGMNCSFEDVVVLDQCIDKFEGNWEAIFQAYQEMRKPDTDAIADLAEDNFYEMRDATADPIFNRKRQIELAMEQQIESYASKYRLVTFNEEIPYHKAMTIGRKQDELLMAFARSHQGEATIDYQALYQHIQEETAPLWAQ